MGRSSHRRKSGKREPNGQLSRKPSDRMARALDGLDREQQDAISVGIAARQRVHGVAPHESRDQRAGSYAGRLCMSGELTRVQYDALMTWLEDNANYAIATCAPRQPGAVDLNRTQGSSGDYENVARNKIWVARYEAAMHAVQAKQIEIRGAGNLHAALYEIMLRDHELPHLVGDLRVAANALSRQYGLVSGRRAA